MSRPKSAIYVVAFLTITVALGGAWVAFKRDDAANARLTSEATATIENVDVRRAVNPIFGNEYTVDVAVTYKYEIDKQEYHQTARLSRSEAAAFTPWSTAKVCFDPGDEAT
ncbi:MAG: hypothetical protein ABJB34_02510 [Acidobacteriota bacterium]